MIKALITEQCVGIELTGDYGDFECLYESLLSLLGKEGEFPKYKTTISRVNAFCFELNQAMLGKRGYINETNGVYAHTHNMKDTILPKVNIHLKLNIHMADILFIVMSLNDLIHQYAVKLTTEKFTPLSSSECMYDLSITTVRLFQSCVLDSLKELLEEDELHDILKKISDKHHNFNDYHSHYIDMLNITHIQMVTEDRENNVTHIINCLYEKNDNYKQLSNELEDASIEYNCETSELRFVEEYPDNIKW